MASKASPAQRVNRAIAFLVVVFFVLSGLAAGKQITTEASSPSTTIAEVVPPPADLTGQRPAETSLSWFNHGFGTEQIDFDMTSLSCRSVAESITPDVCAVARTQYGEFMLVGTEGFWDQSEFDADGTTWIPLNFAVFVMRDDLEGPRAISILDGVTEKAFTDLGAVIDLYVAQVNGDDVLVLHKRQTDKAKDPYSFRESVQILAMSPSGAPTLVATYEGNQLRVASSGASIELSSLRYRASNTTPNPQWFTRISVFPNKQDAFSYGWNEIVTSQNQEVPNGQGMKREAQYLFPSTRPATSDL